MIRHIHNAVPNSYSSRTAARPNAKPQAETNPFRNVLDAASPAPAAAIAAGSQPATIKAAITKEATKAAAKPVVILPPPVFENVPTVTNPDGSTGALNWTQFADASTAEHIAAKLGGTVDTSTMSGYSASQRSIRVEGSPNLVNAGIAAQLFAQYGDKPGSLAWQVINRDLGRDPMST